MSETIQVALFPIPQMVAFPGTTLPLHVFETRYRAMINHCISQDMMLAISHTRKALSTPKKPISPEVALHQNQTTYESCDVFSAGHCELLKITDDGRMYIDVKIIHRLEKLQVVQEVPFQVVDCHILADQPTQMNARDEQDMVNDINQLLLIISQQHSPELYEIIKQPQWQQMDPAEFSFKVFSYFRFEADFMQQVLEQTVVANRLKLIWQGLSQGI